MFISRPGALALILLLLPAVALADRWPHEGGTLTLDKTPERIIALNWAATEALLLLGVTPVGVADRDGYDYWVKKPALPDQVPNIGTRVAPSLEAIAELKPDLIVTSAEMAPAADLLKRIAPTTSSASTGKVAPLSPRRRRCCSPWATFLIAKPGQKPCSGTSNTAWRPSANASKRPD